MSSTAANDTARSDKLIGSADRRFRLEGLGLTLVIIALGIVFTFINPRFANVDNFLNILTQASTYIIVAMGMTFVISMAGIDLSVGSMLALVTCVFFGFIDAGMASAPALAIMFALGAALGAINGLMVAFLAIPSLIATLGTMVAYRGIALLHSSGKLYYGLPPEIVWLGQGHVFGVPVPVIIAAVFVAFSWWLFNRTRFGVHCRAVGGNREAARLAGLSVNRIEVVVYAFMGICVTVGGLIWMARIDGTQATLGTAMEIHVIAATIIGGTSLFGGSGTIYGTLAGSILLTMLNNALVIAGVEFFWQLVAIGVIVVVAVTLNNIRENRIEWLRSSQLRHWLHHRRAAPDQNSHSG
ncbi:MAG: ABC transporter permease [Hyphomicrobiales bacterium]|nr:ABC transporter permease [Hyphomicrobiales bacterium]